MCVEQQVAVILFDPLRTLRQEKVIVGPVHELHVEELRVEREVVQFHALRARCVKVNVELPHAVLLIVQLQMALSDFEVVRVVHKLEVAVTGQCEMHTRCVRIPRSG